jgi:effector-binding domain-containing protein
MANFEFNLTSMQSRSKTNTTIEKNYKNNFDQIRMSRIRTFKNHRMLVSVKVEDNVLKIIGDSQNNNDLKVIEIPKDEAIEFI